MTGFLQPAPELMALLFIKKFVWLQALSLLAALRVLAGRGPSRGAALAALLLALAGIAVTLAPALGLSGGALAGAARLMAAGGGWPALLLPSALLALSGLLPGRRWRGIDLLHGAALLGLAGLWLWAA